MEVKQYAGSGAEKKGMSEKGRGMFSSLPTGVDTEKQNAVRGREGAMSIRTGKLHIRQTKERSKEKEGMSGKSHAHKGVKLWTDAIESLSSSGIGISTAKREIA